MSPPLLLEKLAGSTTGQFFGRAFAPAQPTESLYINIKGLLLNASVYRLFKLKQRYRDVFETMGVLLPRMAR